MTNLPFGWFFWDQIISHDSTDLESALYCHFLVLMWPGYITSRVDAAGDQEVLPQCWQRTIRLGRQRLLLVARRPLRQRHLRRRRAVRRASVKSLLLSYWLQCLVTDAACLCNAATSPGSTSRARSLRPSAASRDSSQCTDDVLLNLLACVADWNVAVLVLGLR